MALYLKDAKRSVSILTGKGPRNKSNNKQQANNSVIKLNSSLEEKFQSNKNDTLKDRVRKHLFGKLAEGVYTDPPLKETSVDVELKKVKKQNKDLLQQNQIIMVEVAETFNLKQKVAHLETEKRLLEKTIKESVKSPNGGANKILTGVYHQLEMSKPAVNQNEENTKYKQLQNHISNLELELKNVQEKNKELESKQTVLESLKLISEESRKKIESLGNQLAEKDESIRMLVNNIEKINSTLETRKLANMSNYLSNSQDSHTEVKQNEDKNYMSPAYIEDSNINSNTKKAFLYKKYTCDSINNYKGLLPIADHPYSNMDGNSLTIDASNLKVDKGSDIERSSFKQEENVIKEEKRLEIISRERSNQHAKQLLQEKLRFNIREQDLQEQIKELTAKVQSLTVEKSNEKIRLEPDHMSILLDITNPLLLENSQEYLDTMDVQLHKLNSIRSQNKDLTNDNQNMTISGDNTLRTQKDQIIKILNNLKSLFSLYFSMKDEIDLIKKYTNILINQVQKFRSSFLEVTKNIDESDYKLQKNVQSTGLYKNINLEINLTNVSQEEINGMIKDICQELDLEREETCIYIKKVLERLKNLENEVKRLKIQELNHKEAIIKFESEYEVKENQIMSLTELYENKRQETENLYELMRQKKELFQQGSKRNNETLITTSPTIVLAQKENEENFLSEDLDNKNSLMRRIVLYRKEKCEAEKGTNSSAQRMSYLEDDQNEDRICTFNEIT